MDHDSGITWTADRAARAAGELMVELIAQATIRHVPICVPDDLKTAIRFSSDVARTLHEATLSCDDRRRSRPSYAQTSFTSSVLNGHQRYSSCVRFESVNERGNVS